MSVGINVSLISVFKSVDSSFVTNAYVIKGFLMPSNCKPLTISRKRNTSHCQRNMTCMSLRAGQKLRTVKKVAYKLNAMERAHAVSKDQVQCHGLCFTVLDEWLNHYT